MVMRISGKLVLGVRGKELCFPGVITFIFERLRTQRISYMVESDADNVRRDGV